MHNEGRCRGSCKIVLIVYTLNVVFIGYYIAEPPLDICKKVSVDGSEARYSVYLLLGVGEVVWHAPHRFVIIANGYERVWKWDTLYPVYSR